MNLFWCNAHVKRFSSNNLPQNFDIMRIVNSAMDDRRDKKSKKKMYITKNVKTGI